MPPRLSSCANSRTTTYDAWAKVRKLLGIVWATEQGTRPALPRDAVEKVEDGVWALRVRGGELWVRLFFTNGKQREIVLLDGIYKKANELGNSDKDRIHAQRADYERRGVADPYWASKPD